MSSARAIAIVGVGGRFPNASSPAALWTNVVANDSAARDSAAGRWPIPHVDVVDGHGSADHARTARQCALDDGDLDLRDLAIPASWAPRLDRLARLTLHVGAQAWRSVVGTTDSRRTSVILANIALPTDGASKLAEQLFYAAADVKMGSASSVALAEPLGAFPSAVPAGLLAQALGLGGGSFTLDAACASSLYAIHLACIELEAGRADAVLSGGVSLPQSIYTQIGFTQLHALSRSGRSAPYDASADGLVVGEGAGVVVLKRLDDAERDGDRILAVIRGVGLSNDVGGSLLSPEREGQLRSMRAAYAEAGWQPDDVDLIEGHGTGTPRGDAVELESLTELWRGLPARGCVLGSVKSNVGHLLTAAGIAGLCKVLGALDAKLLPPSAHFATPAPGLLASPFRVLQRAEAWPTRANDAPRRAAISGFGFGGINAHLLLEEATTRPTPHLSPSPSRPRAQERKAVPIAIVGMAAHVGRLDSLAKFRHASVEGETIADPLPRERWHGLGRDDDAVLGRLLHLRGAWIDSFALPAQRFKLAPNDVPKVQPQQLLMLKVAADALEDLRVALGQDAAARARIGVVIGIGLDLESTSFHLRWLARARVRSWAKASGSSLDELQIGAWASAIADAVAPALDATRTLGALGGIVPSRIAREFKLGGPSFAVSGDEASGLRAIEVAARLLQRGDVDAMLAGAVDLAGDVRAVVAGDALRAFSPSSNARAFDSRADGSKIAEGAGAVVLKRLDDAVAAGDRIYAVLRGLGAAGSGPLAADADRHAAYVRAGRAAQAEASVSAGDVSLVEAHGSGAPDEDAVEARALAELFQTSIPTSGRTAISSTAALVGQAGAAASMLSVIKAALCLSAEVLPPLARDLETPSTAVDWTQTPFHLPRVAERWLRDREGGPRRAAVASMGRDGSCVHAILEGHDAASLASSAPVRRAALFLLRGPEAAPRLRDLTATHPGGDLEALAVAWHRAGATDASAVTRAIVATSTDDLLRQLEASAPPAPVERTGGQVAFVFPGSGNHFVGMGRELALALPEVYRHLDDEVLHLDGHLSTAWVAPHRTSWAPGWETDAKDALAQSPERTIVAQVAHGIAVSDALAHLGLRPAAFVGYSLGESAALFASRTWRDRDAMFARTLGSSLFRTELCGPRTVVQGAWGEGADWKVVIVTRPAPVVRGGLVGTAALLIVNAPEECVIGGRSRDVDATVEALGCGSLPLEGVPSVHLAIVAAVRDAYHEHHRLATTPPEGVTIYSGAWARSYSPTTESAADSLLANALSGFDFPALVERAYADGARIFVEAGPQGSCTRMIRRILQGRPHLAVTACQGAGADGYRSLLTAVARVAEAGGHVDLGLLYGRSAAPAEVRELATTKVTLGGIRRPWPAPPERAADVVPAAPPPMPAPARPRRADLGAFFAANEATVAAHETFLRVARDNLALSFQLLQQPSTARLAPVPRRAPLAAAVVPPLLDRAACLEFAVGRIGNVLGPSYADVDLFPTRVRLPDEPLMLVDRILSVSGEAGIIGPGSVVTEHDVRADAWYLDGGRAPVCISVEAGQADLFLSAYLGIDREARGERVYRLLDAKIRFHRDLPRPGECIRYDIRIDRFIRQGDTWLFFFRFDGTIDGAPFITMFDGCAGFFSHEQLSTSGGIVRTRAQGAPATRLSPSSEAFVPLVAEARAGGGADSLDAAQLAALRTGDLGRAFGASFAGKTLAPSMRLPSGRMKLVDRILSLEPSGGSAGKGRVVGEADITPEAWFLVCHFVGDHVMPGTLMYECCLHTLRVLLLRMGWIATDATAEVHYAPIPEVASELKCRGQVTRDTKRVRYEVDILEIGYGPEPYVIAAASMFADGKHVVQMDGMSARVVGLTRSDVEALWAPSSAPGRGEPRSFDREQIVAYAEGNPSAGFGDRYRPFDLDSDRRLARLPRDPFLFVDRVLEVTQAPWVLEPGGWTTCELVVAPDAWYFSAGGQGTMPFAVLLEAALQPCGWLAAYLGSALLSDLELKFRNLDGTGTQHGEVTSADKLLTTRARLTKTSKAGGMILQEFDLEILSGTRLVYEGKTGFGFFPAAALAAQVGVRGAAPWTSSAAASAFDLPRTAPLLPTPAAIPPIGPGLSLPSTALAMIDRIAALELTGGSSGLGFVVGTKRVDPDEWFFRAHFFQDPVMPGSLGLEALLTLLKVFARERFPELARTHRFHVMAGEKPHTWQYRGQVTPQNREVRVEVEITSIEVGSEPLIVARGQLSVDGKIIYTMRDFALGLVPAA
jgi:acyl transferase domain-containing protein/3-hydroxymyristoyl/3-hydroxydecanoyl-(acyl carrier protein) dehydratase